MSAPPQGLGGGGGGLSPATFLGTYSRSNPSNPPNGYWWYRIDLGQIWANINGTIMPLQNTGAVTIISSNTTIANTDVYNDIVVLPGVTLTIYGAVTFHGNVIIENGATLLSSNPNASSTSPATNTYSFLGNFYLNGTYSIAQYNTDVINNSVTISTIAAAGGASPTISGAGTLSIPSGCTLTVSANVMWSIPLLKGAGTLSVSSGYTLTVSANVTWSIPTVSGAGTLSVSSRYTLTIGANVTWSISTVSGAGTLSVPSGYTLTQGSNITISIGDVNVAGTWVNAGYVITIPSGATVWWVTTGSLATTSPAGTLMINGILYYYGISLSGPYGAEPGVPPFPFTLTGTGIGLFTSNKIPGGGAALSLSNVSLGAGSNSSSSVSATGIVPYMVVWSIKGSAVGKYVLELYYSNTYHQIMLVYIGTANTTYSVSFTGVDSGSDTSGSTCYARNSSNSAGTITITGTLYA